MKLCQDDHYGDARGWHGAGRAVLALALRSGTPVGPIGTDVEELAERCASHLLLLLHLLFIHLFSILESELEVNGLIVNLNYIFIFRNLYYISLYYLLSRVSKKTICLTFQRQSLHYLNTQAEVRPIDGHKTSNNSSI